jgi:glutamate--cysteine ligase
MQIEKLIQERLMTHQAALEEWFRQSWQATPALIYGSLDIRHAGFKAVPVDMNLFPAGFNNLHADNLEQASLAMQSFIQQQFPGIKNILLIPESHTRNMFYFESLAILTHILIQAGCAVRIGFLGSELELPKTVELNLGKKILLEKITRENGKVFIDNFMPDLIVLNNDCSSSVPEILKNLTQPIIPSYQLGWSSRLKSQHFSHYESVVNHVSHVIDIDPWLLKTEFRACGEVNFLKREGEECLAHHSGVLLASIREKYKQYGITEEPFVVIKADAGTYGMSVMMISDPSEIVGLNRKARTTMSASKGGNLVHQVMVQEGVHSIVKRQQKVAEPVMYLIGQQVVGGFYRVHAEKSASENLNSPGMFFEPFVYQPSKEFSLYTFIAQLSMLAAARENNEK